MCYNEKRIELPASNLRNETKRSFLVHLSHVSPRSELAPPHGINFVKIAKPALTFFFSLTETLSSLFYPHRILNSCMYVVSLNKYDVCHTLTCEFRSRALRIHAADPYHVAHGRG